MATLFNKKFHDITIDDVRHLVEQKTPESVVLDYKQKFNSREATKLISAMANTYGGFIVYGVKCDSDTNLPVDLVSIANRKLDDTIDSLCIDSITPPVFCEGQYLGGEDGEPRLFVVKVPESDMTPHAIDDNTTVYLKVAGQKRRIGKANLDQVEWLKQRRKRFLDRREKLITQSRERMLEILPTLETGEYSIETIVVPKYPSKQLVPVSELWSFIDKLVKNFQSTRPYTLVSNAQARHYNGGICIHHTYDDICLYIDINSYGFLRYAMIADKAGSGESYLNLWHVSCMILTGLLLGASGLKMANYPGKVIAGIRINSIKNTKAMHEFKGGGTQLLLADKECQIDDKLSLHGICDMKDIDEDIRVLLAHFMSDLVFMFGVRERSVELGRYFCEYAVKES